MANLSEKYQKITQDNEHVSCVFLFSLEMCCSLQFFTTGLSLSLSLCCARGATETGREGTGSCACCALFVLLTCGSVESLKRGPPLNGNLANLRVGEAGFMQMCWQGRRSGSFICFQRERWVNAKVILHKGTTVLEQNTAARIAGKKKRGFCFLAERSLIFFHALQGKWRTFIWHICKYSVFIVILTCTGGSENVSNLPLISKKEIKTRSHGHYFAVGYYPERMNLTLSPVCITVIICHCKWIKVGVLGRLDCICWANRASSVLLKDTWGCRGNWTWVHVSLFKTKEALWWWQQSLSPWRLLHWVSHF